MDSINKILDSTEEIEPVYMKKRGIVLLRMIDNLVFISGHGPEDQITGKPLFSGRIGGELSPEQGYVAARECAIIILGALKDTIGSLDRIERIIKVFGLINCEEGFSALDSIMDGFSDALMEVLEERGYHTRTVIGTHNLPNGNIPVEVEAIIALR
jgi:enamine deaminase RidA (YjgF/YER057c/UK114 family)